METRHIFPNVFLLSLPNEWRDYCTIYTPSHHGAPQIITQQTSKQSLQYVCSQWGLIWGVKLWLCSDFYNFLQTDPVPFIFGEQNAYCLFGLMLRQLPHLNLHPLLHIRSQRAPSIHRYPWQRVEPQSKLSSSWTARPSQFCATSFLVFQVFFCLKEPKESSPITHHLTSWGSPLSSSYSQDIKVLFHYMVETVWCLRCLMHQVRTHCFYIVFSLSRNSFVPLASSRLSPQVVVRWLESYLDTNLLKAGCVLGSCFKFLRQNFFLLAGIVSTVPNL